MTLFYLLFNGGHRGRNIQWGGKTSHVPLKRLSLMISPAQLTALRLKALPWLNHALYMISVQRCFAYKNSAYEKSGIHFHCNWLVGGLQCRLGTIHSLGLPLFVPVYCFIFLSENQFEGLRWDFYTPGERILRCQDKIKSRYLLQACGSFRGGSINI